MSSESIDLLWNASIEELKRLVQEEEAHGRPGDGGNAKPASVDEAFRHFADLYVRYTLVLSDLNQCHEASVQPQKRIDIRATLEGVICRVINLRHLLVKWCPPNADVASKGGAAQAPFPWEHPDLNGVLRERSGAPSRLETATPAYFGEDRAEATRQRDSVVARFLGERTGSDVDPTEGEEAMESPAVADASSSDSGQCIEEAETAEATQPVDAPDKPAEALPPEEAATKVQSIVRGNIGRQRTGDIRRELDNLIGMGGSESADERAETDTLESNLVDVRSQRRAEQQYCNESYENDLHRLKDVVRDEEGFRMQNELREERLQWITEHTISKNALPDSFEGFYAKDESPEHDKENEDGAKGKGNKKEGDKGAKDKGGKSKDKKEAKEVERPVLAANPALLDPLRDCIRIYGERWQHRNVGPDRVKSQYHDVEMAKDLIVRDQVRSELTKGVDEAMLSNILKIKEMQEANAKKGKKKDAKGKKAKGKKKAGGGKKEKPLPGAKIPGMKEMSAEEMLSMLVQNGLVSIPEEHAIGDFVGGFENERPKLPNAGQERWIPDDPSAFQLRKAIMGYCILPLGSESIKSSIRDEENVRSILLYGPEGCGKTLMVQTVASEIGALMVNLSSSTIGSAFEGKEGATKLIHMAFTVAKEKAYAPVLIHLGDCHEFFLAKPKKGGSGSAVNTEMQRYQKDLLVYKNQALKKEDRVIVIGCTSMPEVGDAKLLRWKGPSGKPEKQGFFERSLYFPRPSHADRAMLWKHFIQRRISGPEWQSNAAPDIDYAALALLSDGWSTGEISAAVETSLSEDRLQSLASSQLREHDFSGQLGKETAPRDDERFLTFTRQITGLDAAWKSVNAGDKAKKKN